MISNEKCREILEDKNLTDEEIITIREQLCKLVEVSMGSYFEGKLKVRNKQNEK